MNRRGFTRFPNDILEALYTMAFTLRELRFLLFLERFTTGCKGRIQIKLSNSDLSITGVDRSDASKVVRKLINKRVIKKVDGFIRFNPRIEDWLVPKHKNYSEERDAALIVRALAKNPQSRGQFTHNGIGNLPTATAKSSSSEETYWGWKESILKKGIKGTNLKKI